MLTHQRDTWARKSKRIAVFLLFILSVTTYLSVSSACICMWWGRVLERERKCTLTLESYLVNGVFMAIMMTPLKKTSRLIFLIFWLPYNNNNCICRVHFPVWIRAQHTKDYERTDSQRSRNISINMKKRCTNEELRSSFEICGFTALSDWKWKVVGSN